MKKFLQESGAVAVIVAFVVALTSWKIPAPMPPNARFLLAVLLFLVAMGIRRLIRWGQRKRAQAPKRVDKG